MARLDELYDPEMSQGAGRFDRAGGPVNDDALTSPEEFARFSAEEAATILAQVDDRIEEFAEAVAGCAPDPSNFTELRFYGRSLRVLLTGPRRGRCDLFREGRHGDAFWLLAEIENCTRNTGQKAHRCENVR